MTQLRVHLLLAVALLVYASGLPHVLHLALDERHCLAGHTAAGCHSSFHHHADEHADHHDHDAHADGRHAGHDHSSGHSDEADCDICDMLAQVRTVPSLAPTELLLTQAVLYRLALTDERPRETAQFRTLSARAPPFSLA